MSVMFGEVDARVDNTADWRDEFTTLPTNASASWQTVAQTGAAAVRLEGNAAGARYMCITLDPRDPTAAYDLVGGAARAVQAPYRVGFSVSISRRTSYALAWFGLVGLDAAGAQIVDGSTPGAISLTGGIVCTGSAATATSVTPHGLTVGQRVAILSTDPRVSGYYIVSGIPTPTTFTFASSLSAATYGTTATATPIDASFGSQECMATLARDATAGNADFVSRSEGLSPWVSVWNPGNSWDVASAPSQGVSFAAAYTYALQPQRVLEFINERDWSAGAVAPVDSTSAVLSQMTRDQLVPLLAPGGYVPRVRVQNMPQLSVPVGRITSISKSGSTTATVTMPGHGLTTSDYVTIYGVRDQTNFANQTIGIVVASVIDANTFTIAFGASATATSYGGTVFRIHGNAQPAGIASSSVQSIAPSSGRLLVTFAASQGSYTIGESVCVTGLVDSTNTAQPTYEGLYRVANTNTTTFQLELEPLTGQTLPGSTITCSGTVFAAPDVRLHFIRSQAHARVAVEIESGRGHLRSQSAIPVNVAAGIGGTTSVNASQVGGSGASTSVDAGGTNRGLGVFQLAPISNTDRASAAITTGGNTGTLSATPNQCIAGVINVTAASGTSPTLDLSLEESYDAGTTWQTVWQAHRIGGVSTVLVPPMTLAGRRRWSWPTPGGTGPSFTVTITTMQAPAAQGIQRQWFDRTIAPNTLNSTTPSWYVEGCKTFGLHVVSAAGATTAPVYTLEFSPDGSTWWTSTATITATASSDLAVAATCPFAPKYMRARITTAGVSAVQTFVQATATS